MPPSVALALGRRPSSRTRACVAAFERGPRSGPHAGPGRLRSAEADAAFACPRSSSWSAATWSGGGTAACRNRPTPTWPIPRAANAPGRPGGPRL